MDFYDIAAALGMVLAIWVLGMTLKSLFEQARGRSILNVSRSFWGMTLGHIGIAVFIVGITLTSIYSTEKDLQVNPGESYELAGFNFNFEGVKDIVGKELPGIEWHTDGIQRRQPDRDHGTGKT